MDAMPNLARGRVDRDGAARTRPQAVEEARSGGAARFLLVRQGDVAVESDEVLVLTAGEVARLHLRNAEDAIYLGRVNGIPYFACDVPAGAEEGSVEFRSVRMHAHEWDDDATALAVESVAILQWRRSARFCQECGRPLRPAANGWEKLCDGGHRAFPRIDPAVIMAIRDPQDRLLLARNNLWPERRYSVLAGFVEAGETPESAVAREAYEEAGIRVEEVRYVASQPWPFPRSLMLAYEARTPCGQEDVRIDEKEIQDARFLSRGELRRAVASGEIALPGPTSIAAMLIERWLSEPLA